MIDLRATISLPAETAAGSSTSMPAVNRSSSASGNDFAPISKQPLSARNFAAASPLTRGSPSQRHDPTRASASVSASWNRAVSSSWTVDEHAAFNSIRRESISLFRGDSHIFSRRAAASDAPTTLRLVAAAMPIALQPPPLPQGPLEVTPIPAPSLDLPNPPPLASSQCLPCVSFPVPSARQQQQSLLVVPPQMPQHPPPSPLAATHRIVAGSGIVTPLMARTAAFRARLGKLNTTSMMQTRSADASLDLSSSTVTATLVHQGSDADRASRATPTMPLTPVAPTIPRKPVSSSFQRRLFAVAAGAAGMANQSPLPPLASNARNQLVSLSDQPTRPASARGSVNNTATLQLPQTATISAAMLHRGSLPGCADRITISSSSRSEAINAGSTDKPERASSTHNSLISESKTELKSLLPACAPGPSLLPANRQESSRRPTLPFHAHSSVPPVASCPMSSPVTSSTRDSPIGACSDRVKSGRVASACSGAYASAMHFIAATVAGRGQNQHDGKNQSVSQQVQPPRLRPDSARRQLPSGVEETASTRALPAVTDSRPQTQARPLVSRLDQDVLATMERRASRVKAFLCKKSRRLRSQRSSNAVELPDSIPPQATTAWRMSSLVTSLDMAHALCTVKTCE
jgi:hypothetical protein